MKKLAFFLALFVGLNASPIARKPEEEANEIIVAKDASRNSTAAWIQRIAHKLKACYYGITKDGLIHELGFGLKPKISNSDLNKNQNCRGKVLNNKVKVNPIWIHYAHELENGFERCDINLFIKRNGVWENTEKGD